VFAVLCGPVVDEIPLNVAARRFRTVPAEVAFQSRDLR
jgi:hypothetical protein